MTAGTARARRLRDDTTRVVLPPSLPPPLPHIRLLLIFAAAVAATAVTAAVIAAAASRARRRHKRDAPRAGASERATRERRLAAARARKSEERAHGAARVHSASERKLTLFLPASRTAASRARARSLTCRRRGACAPSASRCGPIVCVNEHTKRGARSLDADCWRASRGASESAGAANSKKCACSNCVASRLPLVACTLRRHTSPAASWQLGSSGRLLVCRFYVAAKHKSAVLFLTTVYER